MTSARIFSFIQKGFLEVVGLDAADVVRCCAVEGVHQHLQGLTELPSSKTEPKSNNTNCQSKLGKRFNSCTRYGTVRAHLEAHRQPVLSDGSFSCANAPIGHRGHVSLQLEQLCHQLRLTHRHADAPVSDRRGVPLSSKEVYPYLYVEAVPDLL